MSRTVVVHARIDTSTKEATERVLDSLGLTPTQAIRLLYRQIAIRGEFPLELKVPNKLTAEILSRADRGEGVERFSSPGEVYASWDE